MVTDRKAMASGARRTMRRGERANGLHGNGEDARVSVICFKQHIICMTYYKSEMGS